MNNEVIIKPYQNHGCKCIIVYENDTVELYADKEQYKAVKEVMSEVGDIINIFQERLGWLGLGGLYF